MTLNSTGCTWYGPDRQSWGENPACYHLKIWTTHFYNSGKSRLIFGSFPFHHVLSDQGAKPCVRSFHLSLRFGQLCRTHHLRNPLRDHWVQLQLSRHTGKPSQIQLLHDTSIICVLFQGIVLVVAVCNMAAYVTLTKTRNTEVEEASNQTWALNNLIGDCVSYLASFTSPPLGFLLCFK